MRPVKDTQLKGYTKISQGKVRDMYEVGGDLLIVATDRMSAYDWVMHEPIPYKGMVLNNLALFWFDYLKDVIDNHIINADYDTFPADLKSYKDVLYGRSVLVKKAKPIKVECIVRGFITGSGWDSYKKDGGVCGIELPKGLQESQELTEPIFTPTTKADEGHDENITFDEMKNQIGADIAYTLRDKSIALYIKAKEYAKKKGIIIADTKMEFGIYDGKIIIIDEVLTPDSSRFWPVDGYAIGKGQKSFDKQFLRDWLTASGWDKNSEPPVLPHDVIVTTAQKYLDAYYRLTGDDLLKKLGIENTLV